MSDTPTRAKELVIEERAKRITNICEPDKFGMWPRAASPGGAMIPPEELADMRATADNLRKTDMNDASGYIDKLFAHIDEQASQIAALKAALLKDRFWLIWKGGECASVERATAKAEHQLATEYPDIVWEDKK